MVHQILYVQLGPTSDQTQEPTQDHGWQEQGRGEALDRHCCNDDLNRLALHGLDAKEFHNLEVYLSINEANPQAYGCHDQEMTHPLNQSLLYDEEYKALHHGQMALNVDDRAQSALGASCYQPFQVKLFDLQQSIQSVQLAQDVNDLRDAANLLKLASVLKGQALAK